MIYTAIISTLTFIAVVFWILALFLWVAGISDNNRKNMKEVREDNTQRKDEVRAMLKK